MQSGCIHMRCRVTRPMPPHHFWPMYLTPDLGRWPWHCHVRADHPLAKALISVYSLLIWYCLSQRVVDAPLTPIYHHLPIDTYNCSSLLPLNLPKGTWSKFNSRTNNRDRTKQELKQDVFKKHYFLTYVSDPWPWKMTLTLSCNRSTYAAPWDTHTCHIWSLKCNSCKVKVDFLKHRITERHFGTIWTWWYFAVLPKPVGPVSRKNVCICPKIAAGYSKVWK